MFVLPSYGMKITSDNAFGASYNLRQRDRFRMDTIGFVARPDCLRPGWRRFDISKSVDSDVYILWIYGSWASCGNGFSSRDLATRRSEEQ